MIVIGVTSTCLRERLLRMDNLNLEDAVKLGQAAEATKKHAYELCRSQENQTMMHSSGTQTISNQNQKTMRVIPNYANTVVRHINVENAPHMVKPV